MYKIDYKALDKGDAHVPEKVHNYLVAGDWQPLRFENFKNMTQYRYERPSSGIRIGFKYYNATGKREVYKFDPVGDEYLTFCDETLKLLDAGGVELTETHIRNTGQHVTDWWK